MKQWFFNKIDDIIGNVFANVKEMKVPANCNVAAGTIFHYIKDVLKSQQNYYIVTHDCEYYKWNFCFRLGDDSRNQICDEKNLIPVERISDFIKSLKEKIQNKSIEKTTYVFIEEIGDLFGLSKDEKDDFLNLLQKNVESNLRFVIFGKNLEDRQFIENIVSNSFGFLIYNQDIKADRFFITDNIYYILNYVVSKEEIYQEELQRDLFLTPMSTAMRLMILGKSNIIQPKNNEDNKDGFKVLVNNFKEAIDRLMVDTFSQYI